MRQPHPELNFRLGRGRIRERQQAFSRESLDHLCDFLGMQPDAKKTFLEECDEIREKEQLSNDEN